MHPSTSFRILCVDDEPDIRFLLESTLSDAYEIVCAADGVEALAKVPVTQPDLIILDLMMPNMDGWEVLVKLRQEPISSKTPVILLSALNQKEDMKKGYQYGASVYLTKPFEVDRLRRNVALMFEGKSPGVKKHTAEYARTSRCVPLATPTPTPAPVAPPAADTDLSTPDLLRTPSAEELVAMDIPPTARPSDLTGRGRSDIPGARGFVPKAPMPSRGNVPGRHGSSAGERPRVLLAIGDAALLEIIRAITDNICESYIVRDADEAEGNIPAVEPDLIVVDARLTRSTGYQLIEALRKDPVAAAIPLIFITEKDVYRERLALAVKGVKHVLGKPLRPYEFTQLVQEILHDPNFAVRGKSSTLAELQMGAGRRKAAIEQKNRPKDTQSTVGSFIRENTKKE